MELKKKKLLCHYIWPSGSWKKAGKIDTKKQKKEAKKQAVSNKYMNIFIFLMNF